MRQCKLCPWKVTTNPRDIPRGYSEDWHRSLADTIAQDGYFDLDAPLRLMACHGSEVGHEVICVGWLRNQLCDGNNIPLRLAVFKKRINADYELDGEQHTCFEDTLPKGV